MRKVTKSTKTDKSKGRIHLKVENNIYRTGKKSYRVKVGDKTGVYPTREAARTAKRSFKTA